MLPAKRPARAAYVLFGYHMVDAAVALKLAAELYGKGVGVFLDRLHLPADADWNHTLQQRQTECAALLALLSPDYLASGYGQAELAMAHRRGIPIIPVLVRYTPFDYSFDPWRYGVDFAGALDLTEWADRTIFEERLPALEQAIRELSAVEVLSPPHPQKRYVTRLIAQLEAHASLLDYITLPYQAQGTDASTLRPAPETRQALALSGPFILREAPLLDESRYLNDIHEAVALHPHFVLMGALGMGTSTVVAQLALEAARAYLADPRDAPMPFYLDLADWHLNESWQAFVERHWPWGADVWQALHDGTVWAYLDGLHEMGLAAADHLQQLRRWITGSLSPRRLIVACEREAYNATLNLGLPIIILEDMTPTYTQRFLTRYLSETLTDKLLAQLTRQTSLEQWRWALENRFWLRMLLFVYRHAPDDPPPTTSSALMYRFVELIWQREQLLRNPDWVPLETVLELLAELAFAAVAARMPGRLPRAGFVDAYVPDRLLMALHSAGLLHVQDDYVSFFHRFFQDFCAGLSLRGESWPAYLTHPQVDERGERTPSAWDGPFVALAGMLDTPDVLIDQIADVNPYLAIRCLSQGAMASQGVRNEAMDALLRLAEAEGHLSYPAFVRALEMCAPDLLKPILDLLRDEDPDVRQLAADIAVNLDLPGSADLVAALQYWQGDMAPHIAEIIQDIGAEAIPPLMRLLSDDSTARRRGAVWALGELNDRAAVVPLVAGLQDTDPLVRAEAARALERVPDAFALPYLVRALRDSTTQVRKAATNAIIAAGRGALPYLRRQLQDKRSDARRIAIGILGHMRRPEVVADLLPFLQDPSVDIRAMAVTALGQIADPSTTHSLAACLNDEASPRWDPLSVSEMAQTALKRIGTEDAMGILDRWRGGRDMQTAQTAKDRLISQSRTGAVQTISDKSENVQARLQKMLHSRRPSERRQAVEMLSKSTNHRVALIFLADALQDPDPDVRLSAVVGLSRFASTKALPHLGRALRDTDAAVAQTAARRLMEIGPESLSVVREAAVDSRADVRGLAIQTLGKIGSQTQEQLILPVLHNALDDEERPSWSDETIGALAAEALTTIGTPTALRYVEDWQKARQPVSPAPHPPKVFPPELPPHLRPEDGEDVPAIITQPVDELTETTPPPVDPKLKALHEIVERLTNGEWKDRQQAAKDLNKLAMHLRGLNHRVVSDEITMLLTSEDDFIRQAGLEAVAWIAEPAAVPLLERILEDESYTFRIAAMRALAEIGEPQAVPSIVRQLNHKNQLVREVAVEVLGMLGDASAVPALLPLLNDSEGFIRRAAIVALGEIRHQQAVPRLLDALDDHDPQTRWVAAQALGKIGAPEAVSALRRHLNDPYENRLLTEFEESPETRLANVVAQALEDIGTQEALTALAEWRNAHQG